MRRRCLRCLPTALVVLLFTAAVLICRPGAPVGAHAADEAPLPDAVELERLAREDPVAFLDACLRRYRQDIRGYSCTFQKQERRDGRLQPTEVIEARFREKPFSVYMHWLEGAGRAETALYVEGENGGKLLARPRGSLARKLAGDVVERGEESPDHRRITDFGMKKNLERMLAALREAREKGHVETKYLGVVKVKEAGNRPCYKLRWHSAEPLDKGTTDGTLYIDKETWLNVGTVLKGEDNKLVGEYFFRDIKVNPEFKPEQFQRSALTP